MAKVGPTEASKLTRKARSTIHRDMKSGKLSYITDEKENKKIDVSELERVYGMLHQDATARNVAQRPNETVRDVAQLLRVQLAAAEEKARLIEARLSDKNERIEELEKDRDHWRGQAETITHLLTDQRDKSSEAEEREKVAQTEAEKLKAELEAEKGRSIWARLLGR